MPRGWEKNKSRELESEKEAKEAEKSISKTLPAFTGLLQPSPHDAVDSASECLGSEILTQRGAPKLQFQVET